MEESMAKAAGKTKANSAFMKPMQPSEHLAKIVGAQPLPRSEVTKKVWAHIKKNKLQNPQNKREILADEKLQPIFGGKKLDMVSNDEGGQQAPEVNTCLVTFSRSHFAEVQEGYVCRDRSSLCCRLSPIGSA